VLTNDGFVYALAILIAFQPTEVFITPVTGFLTSSLISTSKAPPTSTSPSISPSPSSGSLMGVTPVIVSSTTSSVPTSSTSLEATPTPDPPLAVHHGFTSAAKAGISVGIAIFVVAVVLGVFVFSRRRGKRREQQKDVTELPTFPTTHEIPSEHEKHERAMEQMSDIYEMDESNSWGKTPVGQDIHK